MNLKKKKNIVIKQARYEELTGVIQQIKDQNAILQVKLFHNYPRSDSVDQTNIFNDSL